MEHSNLFVEIAHERDLGESAAICCAVEHDADLVSLDERDGRRVARRHDLNVTGVVGVLLRGANVGEVALEHELDALREAGGWISDDLRARVLSEANEQRGVPTGGDSRPAGLLPRATPLTPIRARRRFVARTRR